MADLDHFKHVNDTYGHLAGDAILREAAARMQAAVRSYDLVGRYGGEEFLIVLPGTSGSNAMQLAERLRVTLAQEPVGHEFFRISITASFGVAATGEGPGEGCQNLIRLADEALYRAKEKGRNRVEWTGAEEGATALGSLVAVVGRPGGD
jgi:diguanylate cyclase (GGDEF)-like protein